MSSTVSLPLTSNWKVLPTVHQEQIFKMIRNDPHSIAAAELTCHSWRQFEFRKAVPKDGRLDLTLYPNITDTDTRTLFASIKKVEVRFSKWDRFINCLSCDPKEESILVTSIDLTGCEKITDKTLKAMEGFSITTLKIKGCTNITGEGLKSLKKMPLHTLVLDETSLESEDLRPLKGISSLKKLSIRECKNIQDLMALRGAKIELLNCAGTLFVSREILPKAEIRLR